MNVAFLGRSQAAPVTQLANDKTLPLVVSLRGAVLGEPERLVKIAGSSVRFQHP
jgi:hypothetical protein